MAKNDVDDASGIPDIERSRDRGSSRLTGRRSHCQQPRRVRDVRGRLSSDGRALRRVPAYLREIWRLRERSIRPRQPNLDRLHTRTVGCCARVGRCVHRRVRGRIAAHVGGARTRGGAALSIARGNRERALRDQLRAIELASAKYDPWQRLGSLAGAVAIYADVGQLDQARALAVQVPPLVREVGLHGALTRLGPYAELLGIRDDLRDAVAAGAGPRVPGGAPWSSTSWRASSTQPQTSSRGRRARRSRRTSASTPAWMLAAGRTADAEIQLARALAFYRTVDAAVHRADRERTHRSSGESA